jgi:hypothetical protein
MRGEARHERCSGGRNMQGTFSSDAANTPAVSATGTNGAEAIQATSDGTTVIEATSEARTALLGGTTSGFGVIGRSLGSGYGVQGDSQSGIGVLGTSASNFAIHGQTNGYSFGVVGTGSNAGVAAFNPDNNHAAYLASGCCAAWFSGGVTVTGPLTKGGGGFRIDHPQDPERRFLQHSFVESPDMKNVYDGVVVTDARGEATVDLPPYFDSLNQDFRYQLTAIGGAAPDLHVSREIVGRSFAIGGARPNVRISWQVTGVRRDAWAQAHRLSVESEKAENERGYFLHPDLFGHGAERSIGERRHPRAGRRA